MGNTTCNACGRTIGYARATICPYCGKPIHVSTPSSSLGQTAPTRGAREHATFGLTATPRTPADAASNVVPTPAPEVPPLSINVRLAITQLKTGLERLVGALQSNKPLDVEIALSQIAVSVAVLRASKGTDIAEAGLGEALKEFLNFKPAEGPSSERIRALQSLLRKLFPAEPARPDTIAQVRARASDSAHAQALLTSPNSLLSQIDAWTFEHFELRKLQVRPDPSPTIYCQTFEEFFASFFAFREMSPEEQARAVREESARARESVASGGGAVLGVNWPGRGCFLSGEAFARLHSKRSADEALRCPQTFPHILSTAIHEKLGHGLLTELTTRGREIRSVHLEQHDVARQFLRRKSDDPREALLLDKWDILLTTSKYSEEGFSTWMESQVAEIVKRRMTSGVRVEATLSDLGAAANVYPPEMIAESLRAYDGEHFDSESCAALADAVEFLDECGPDQRAAAIQLFSGPFPHTDLQHASAERDEAIDRVSSTVFGQPWHYVMGYALVHKIERLFGAHSVPYALAIAGNVSHGLENLSNSDLRLALQANPQLRMDVRLLMLGTLRGVPQNDPAGLFEAARRELSLTPPQLVND